MASKLNNIPVIDISPAMLVRDFHGKVIYNSTYSSELLKYGAFNDDPRLNHPMLAEVPDAMRGLYTMSDFVQLTYGGSLVQPIAIVRSERLEKGEVVYLSGYPGATKLFAKRDGDTRGEKDLVSSSGQLTNYSDDQKVFTSSALGTPGMSGGLVTTADGAAIGLACGTNEGLVDFKPDIVTSGSYLDPEGLTAFWKSIVNATIQSAPN